MPIRRRATFAVMLPIAIGFALSSTIGHTQGSVQPVNDLPNPYQTSANERK